MGVAGNDQIVHAQHIGRIDPPFKQPQKDALVEHAKQAAAERLCAATNHRALDLVQIGQPGDLSPDPARAFLDGRMPGDALSNLVQRRFTVGWGGLLGRCTVGTNVLYFEANGPELALGRATVKAHAAQNVKAKLGPSRIDGGIGDLQIKRDELVGVVLGVQVKPVQDHRASVFAYQRGIEFQLVYLDPKCRRLCARAIDQRLTTARLKANAHGTNIGDVIDKVGGVIPRPRGRRVTGDRAQRSVRARTMPHITPKAVDAMVVLPFVVVSLPDGGT